MGSGGESCWPDHTQLHVDKQFQDGTLSKVEADLNPALKKEIHAKFSNLTQSDNRSFVRIRECFSLVQRFG